LFASVYGYNNPCRIAIREIQDDLVFQGRPVGCIISIGTGLKGMRDASAGNIRTDSDFVLNKTKDWLPKKSILQTLDSITKTPRRVQELIGRLIRMACNTEDDHNWLLRDYESEYQRYYRFNPPSSLGDIDLADVTLGSFIEGLAGEYTGKHDVDRSLQKAARQLKRVKDEPLAVLAEIEAAKNKPLQSKPLPMIKDSYGRHSVPGQEPRIVWESFVEGLRNVHSIAQAIRQSMKSDSQQTSANLAIVYLYLFQLWTYFRGVGAKVWQASVEIVLDGDDDSIFEGDLDEVNMKEIIRFLFWFLPVLGLSGGWLLAVKTLHTMDVTSDFEVTTFADLLAARKRLFVALVMQLLFVRSCHWETRSY
jgi:hypothetical protein